MKAQALKMNYSSLFCGIILSFEFMFIIMFYASHVNFECYVIYDQGRHTAQNFDQLLSTITAC